MQIIENYLNVFDIIVNIKVEFISSLAIVDE